MAKKTILDELASRQYKGLTFDELNALYDDENDPMSMDYDEYFDDMDLTEPQKEKRKNTAEEIERVFRDLLALVFYLYVEGAYDYTEAIMEAQTAYVDVLKDIDVSDYFSVAHVPNAVTSVVNTMLTNPGNPFNFTIDRAILIAENEANSIWNDAEYEEALKSGKKRKTWHTILDKRTRDWHAEVNWQTKPITEPFEVNGELLQFPRDESLGASGGNIVNCRCSVTYS